MYLFFIDESGNVDPKSPVVATQGRSIYVVTALAVFVRHARELDLTLNRHKSMLIDKLVRRGFDRLELSECEIKSNWLRRPDERAKHALLGKLDDKEVNDLVAYFYRQLDDQNITVISVIVDKPLLRDHMNPGKLQRKAWELLLQKIEQFMRAMHEKHQAILITDDTGASMNRTLAMKHAYIMLEGTKVGVDLKHICGMPLFVPSELSNGVQLADLCAYNIYRAFSRGDLSYIGFQKIEKFIWSAGRTMKNARARPFSGLYVFPGGSEMEKLVQEFEQKKKPRPQVTEASKMMSGGANPIEPTSGTGQRPSEEPTE